MSIESKIEMNLYIDLDEDTEDGVIKFTFANKTITVPVSEGIADEYEGRPVRIFKCPLAAQEMTDTITVQLINGTKEGAITHYSFADYAYGILDSDDYEDVDKNVVKAMLNYGTACQEYFNYNTDYLANYLLDPVDQAEVESVPLSQFDNYKNIARTKNIPGISYHRTSALFTSETVLRYYYLLDKDRDISEYTFTVNGKEYTPILEKGTYRIDIPVAASDFEEDYLLTVSDGTNTHKIRASIYSYLKNAISKPENADLIPVAQAMYRYCNAVRAKEGK